MLERFKKMRPAAVVSLVMSLISATSLSAAEGDSAQMRSLENRVTALEARKGVCAPARPAVKDGVDISLGVNVNYQWSIGMQSPAVLGAPLPATPATGLTPKNASDIGLTTIAQAGPDGNWGVGVTLGYETPSDGIMIQAEWNWFEAKQEQTFTGSVYYPTMLPGQMNAVGGILTTGTTTPPYTMAGMAAGPYADVLAESKATMNEGLLSLLRPSYLSKYFIFSPEIALKGLWFDVKQEVKYQMPYVDATGLGGAASTAATSGEWDIMAKDHAWAVGASFKLEAEARLWEMFGLYGNMSFSPMYGHHHITRQDNITSPGATAAMSLSTLESKEYNMFFAAKTELGMSLGGMFDHDRYAIDARLYWMADYVPGVYVMPVLSGGNVIDDALVATDIVAGQGEITYIVGDYATQGIALRLTLDF